MATKNQRTLQQTLPETSGTLTAWIGLLSTHGRRVKANETLQGLGKEEAKLVSDLWSDILARAKQPNANIAKIKTQAYEVMVSHYRLLLDSYGMVDTAAQVSNLMYSLSFLEKELNRESKAKPKKASQAKKRETGNE